MQRAEELLLVVLTCRHQKEVLSDDLLVWGSVYFPSYFPIEI